MKKNLLLIAAIIGYFSAYLLSCEHDDKGLDATSIKSITATPTSISQGGTLTLTIESEPVGTATFLWNSALGEFSDPQNDTTEWKAPAEPGIYVISVVVTDDLGTNVGSVNVGVDVYIPEESPSYVGLSNCAQCHQEVTHEWEGTAHAEAIETLEGIFQDGNTRCLTCHTVGHDPDIANGGFDEVPIGDLADVGCESCHGPGSEHNGDLAGIDVSFDANTCGTCHQDEHHPYIEEWSASAHATSLESAGGFVVQNQNCVKCHVSEAFVEFTKTGETPLIEDLKSMNPINCQSCHDPHSATGKGQLRIASVDLVCGECHTAGSIDDLNDPGTPHHSQWNMLHGTDGVEYAGVEYIDSPHQFVVEGKCASCHVSMVPFMGEGAAAKTGHTFEAELRACTTCHPSATDFDVNGVQTEIIALLAQLKGELDAATDTESVPYKQALYNLEFVEADASNGVHNFKYAKALLESSINDFNP